MNNMRNKVTIITVNYNNLEGLKRTIPSVLSQTFHDYEYIVIDGGSTDGSKEYIESQQQGLTYWVSERDKGIYPAMNKGIAQAHGEYCIFMNSGDHFFSSVALEQASLELDGTDFCVGKTIVIDERLAYLCTPPQKLSFNFIKDKALIHQSIFIKTQLLQEHPYNEKLKIVSDWANILESWCFYNSTYKPLSPIISAYYRDGLSSLNEELLSKERLQVIKDLFGENLPHEKISKEEKRERLDDEFNFKLRRAIALGPIARDWKIIRNGFKFLWRDLFY